MKHRFVFRTTITIVSLCAASSYVAAASTPKITDHSMHTGTEGHVMPADCPMMNASGDGVLTEELPELLGQDAFAALAEMRVLLEANPETDWSRVDLDAFRSHLVDMNRVTLDAELEVEPVAGGFEARVTGRGRTLEAIQRMIPAHSRFVDGRDGLSVSVSTLEAPEQTGGEEPLSGVRVTVTTSDPALVAKVRGLGFFGFLAAGDHHRPHHRAMALGAPHP